MLSYQHPYHAGSNTDCHKHSLLCLLLQRLADKETAFSYVDLHSARGLYDLKCAEAQKTKEYETGISQLWPLKDWPPSLAPYQQLVHALNAEGALRYYPGSPRIASALLRAQDRLYLYELHPQEFPILKSNMGDDPRVQCYASDGWKALTDHMPPKEKRGMVLIDPSYELKEDYTLMAPRLQKAVEKWRNGVYVIWYPILAANRHHTMLEQIRQSGLRKILVSEILFRDPANGQGIIGSGMLFLNPPWKLEEAILPVMDWLVASIGQSHQCTWLVEE